MTNVLPTYPRSNLEFTHGVGSYLYTKSGEKFLDFGTGIAVNSLGYSNPYLNDKLKKQIDRATKEDLIKPREGTRILDEYLQILKSQTYLNESN